MSFFISDKNFKNVYTYKFMLYVFLQTIAYVMQKKMHRPNIPMRVPLVFNFLQIKVILRQNQQNFGGMVFACE